jgi:cation transport ATPase
VTATEATRVRAPGSLGPAIRLGLVTGVGLIAVMIFALLAANRIPWLNRSAVERIWISYIAFAVVMVLPVARFFRAPLRIFVSGMIGWFLFTVGYAIAGWLFFQNLSNRLKHDALEVFVLGSFLYGVAAVGVWVCSLVAATRHYPIVRRRPRPR